MESRCFLNWDQKTGNEKKLENLKKSRLLLFCDTKSKRIHSKRVERKLNTVHSIKSITFSSSFVNCYSNPSQSHFHRRMLNDFLFHFYFLFCDYARFSLKSSKIRNAHWKKISLMHFWKERWNLHRGLLKCLSERKICSKWKYNSKTGEIWFNWKCDSVEASIQALCFFDRIN